MPPSLIWDESTKLPRYHPHLPRTAQHTFRRYNGRTHRRGLAGAHGRTKRTFTQGAFSLWQPLSEEKSFRYFPDHSFSQPNHYIPQRQRFQEQI